MKTVYRVERTASQERFPFYKGCSCNDALGKRRSTPTSELNGGEAAPALQKSSRTVTVRTSFLPLALNTKR